jgi:hypothetical protein
MRFLEFFINDPYTGGIALSGVVEASDFQQNN